MFGGEEYNLPRNHKAGIIVPRGGSCCANCLFLGKDHKTCENKNWIAWNGGNNELPVEDERYCSDWWEPRKLQRKI